MVHLCYCRYKTKKDEPWRTGLAVLEEAGMCNIITLLDDKGVPVTAPDGGSPEVWNYDLLAYRFAVSVNMEK